MKRFDDDFLNELEGRIDETFKETQPGRREVSKDHGHTAADENDISDPGPPPSTHDDVAGQVRGAGTSSLPYHPMEISTHVIVTRENVEFAVRKFVKDLKECLRLSKTISIRFEIKTVSNDNGQR